MGKLKSGNNGRIFWFTLKYVWTKVEEDVQCKLKRIKKGMVKNKIKFVENLTEILFICYISFRALNVPRFLL
jgi:hypothetical protein